MVDLIETKEVGVIIIIIVININYLDKKTYLELFLDKSFFY